MMTKTVIAVAIVLLGVMTSGADNRASLSRGLNFAKAPGITAQQATSAVRRVTGGRVISVLPTKNGSYKVRVLLAGGRVKTVLVDRKGDLR